MNILAAPYEWIMKVYKFLFLFVGLQPWSFKVKLATDPINGKMND